MPQPLIVTAALNGLVVGFVVVVVVVVVVGFWFARLGIKSSKSETGLQLCLWGFEPDSLKKPTVEVLVVGWFRRYTSPLLLRLERAVAGRATSVPCGAPRFIGSLREGGSSGEGPRDP